MISTIVRRRCFTGIRALSYTPQKLNSDLPQSILKLSQQANSQLENAAVNKVQNGLLKSGLLDRNTFTEKEATLSPRMAAASTPLMGVEAGRTVAVGRDGNPRTAFRKLQSMTTSLGIRQKFYADQFYLKPSKKKLQRRIKNKKIRFMGAFRNLLSKVKDARRRGY
ncbi:unnamed protein product [Kuraishia capsulata CBS 1993]|uniref:Uncharacterized protein n=1 Tax=Kuraishia capsulata CBS 1993 TaxID=1382522 RepID=W6MMP4_9ASCO|nr:uncharacterized protein KUCA_T00003815001 [Kuraishia capsulata CBS 1993]CDK27836.1 unnamed protein product [Kuraishia capsulata CBS 1993]